MTSPLACSNPRVWSVALVSLLVGCAEQEPVDLPAVKARSRALIPAPKRLPANTALVPVRSGLAPPKRGAGLLADRPDVRVCPAAPVAASLPSLDADTRIIVERQHGLAAALLSHLPVAKNAVRSGWLAHAVVTAMQAAAKEPQRLARHCGFAEVDRTLEALSRLRRRVLGDAKGSCVAGKALRLDLGLGVFTAGPTGPVSTLFRRRLARLEATVRALPFEARSRLVVDRWIAERTNNEVKEAFSREHERMPELSLIATGYIRAPWRLPFSTRRTTKDLFFIAPCRARLAPMMRQTMYLSVEQTDVATVADVPFVGETFALRVVVPRELAGLRTSRGKLLALLRRGPKGGRENVDIALPRLKLSARANLLEVAKKVLPEATRLAAYPEFGTTRPRRIEKLSQYGFLKVEEWGAEAALGMLATIGYGGGRAEPLRLRADRPFLLAIVHQPSGAQLFSAQVADVGQALPAGRCYRPLIRRQEKKRSGTPRISFEIGPESHASAAVLRRIVRRYKNELRYCVARERASLVPKMSCSARFQVDRNGKAVLTRPPPVVLPACGCMNEALRRWRFPSPRAPQKAPTWRLVVRVHGR